MNIGIVFAKLSLDDVFDPRRTGIGDSHVRSRVGYFFDEHDDILWTILSREDAEEACGMLGDVLLERVIPAIAEFMNEQEVIRLWRSGCASGLTEVQRVRNRKILEEG